MKKISAILIAFLLHSCNEKKANEISSVSPEEIKAIEQKPVEYAAPADSLGSQTIIKPEIQPQYEGGMQEFARQLQLEIRYPETARQQGIEGKVYVAFVVDKTGHVRNATVKKGVSPELDREAIRALYELNNWKPAMHNGQPVKVKMVIPVKFKLQ